MKVTVKCVNDDWSYESKDITLETLLFHMPEDIKKIPKMLKDSLLASLSSWQALHDAAKEGIDATYRTFSIEIPDQGMTLFNTKYIQWIAFDGLDDLEKQINDFIFTDPA